ncbi:hypothetical protein TWF694_002759 [Orbilia ellipsospora]
MTLHALAFVFLLAIASSLSHFQDENIISATGARLLLTPNEVLLRRLETFRIRQGVPNISNRDILLLNALKTREGRLLYAAYGPRPLIECAWCTPLDPTSYLYYRVPSIALPHIANIAILGVATSSFSSKVAGSLRIHATIAGLAVAMGEVLVVYNFDILQNTQAARPEDTYWFHWQLLTYRGISIAAVNFLFGVALYLSATGRYGFAPVSDREKIEAVAKSIELGLGHIRTSLFVKSTTIRNDSTLDYISNFWKKEAANRQEIANQLETTKSEVLGRMDIESINQEAFKFTSNLFDAMTAAKPTAGPDHVSPSD